MKKSLAVGLLLIIAAGMFAAEGDLSAERLPLCSAPGNLTFHLDVPDFSIVSTSEGESRIQMADAGYVQRSGYPRLPMPTYTFALPPGSKVVDVEVSGTRTELEGSYTVEAALPSLPVSASNRTAEELFKVYEQNRARVYSGKEELSYPLGEIRATGERREYSMVTVGIHPFSYRPVTGKLSVAEEVTVTLKYAPVSAEHAEFISRFMEKGTINPEVPSNIYNRDQAREWYRPSRRLLAVPGMLILTTQELVDSTSEYVSWRSGTGFEVDVVSVEDVTSQTEGEDTPQKIRNYLREHAADYQYLFIMGHHADIPMRVLTPFNNNIHPVYYDENITPNPSDIYYGDLSKPDDQSWNKDGDQYYGEGMDAMGTFTPQDDPDLEMELHVGRINNSYPNTVPGILEKTWLFEQNTDDDYKNRSVLGGGILWYDNQNGSGLSGFDGAFYMEFLQNNEIVDPSLAYTLYEKAGDGPSEYECDQPLTNDNLIDAINNHQPGIFVENNHGWKNRFSRCVWNDDGDGIPEEGVDLSWPEGLSSTDAFKLDDDSPNVAFLLSCLNGYPEDANCLAQALLNNGSVAVVAHTRSALGRRNWGGPGSGGQNALYYYLLQKYISQETFDHVLGDAVDAARLEYFNTETRYSKFINTYSHTLYGDPALRHFGRAGTVAEEKPSGVSPLTLTLTPDQRIRFSLPAAGKVDLNVWDVAGRRVQTLYEGNASAGTRSISWDTDGLASGTYFITLRTETAVKTTKAVVIH